MVKSLCHRLFPAIVLLSCLLSETLIAEVFWKSAQSPLKDAIEGEAFSVDLNDFLKDDAKAKGLKFDFVGDKPPWLEISDRAILGGIPSVQNVRTLRFKITAIEATTPPVTEVITFTLNVTEASETIQWVQASLQLPPAKTGLPYTQTLKGSVINPLGRPLTFSLISDKTWLTVHPDGKIEGTPPRSDGAEPAKVHQWVVQVTDETFSPRTTIVIPVAIGNEPPSWRLEPGKTSIDLRPAKEGDSYFEDLAELVMDPDEQDQLQFTLEDAPPWLRITPEGQLQGRPNANDADQVHKIRVRVTDQKSPSVLGLLNLPVVHVNHLPKWKVSPIEDTVKEDSEWKLDLRPFVSDEDPKDFLSFSVVSGFTWATLDATGVIHGIPRKDQVRELQVFTIRADDGQGGTRDVQVKLTVIEVNHPPQWDQEEFAIEKRAMVGKAFKISIASLAKDIDLNDALHFSRVSPPGWADITAEGEIAGIPNASAEARTTELKVEVRDKEGLTDLAIFKIDVDQANSPPTWNRPLINLGNLQVGAPVTFELSTEVSDPEMDPLEFHKASGPAWLSVDEVTGQVHGSPPEIPLGPFVGEFEVSDAYTTVRVDYFGKIITKANQPPKVPANLNFALASGETRLFSIKDRVTDPEDDALTFSSGETTDWAKLSPDGILKLTPARGLVGSYSFRFSVTDGTHNVGAVLTLDVTAPTALPPKWNENPISISINVGDTLSINMAPKVTSLNGQSLQFKKISGASWVTLNGNGSLTGKAESAHIGQNHFGIEATNPYGSTPATLIVDVKGPAELKQTLRLSDNGERPAQLDILWVVDHSLTSRHFMRQFDQSMNGFYETLKSNGISTHEMLLSTNYQQWQGYPVFEKGTFVFSGVNAPEELRLRMRKIESMRYGSSPLFSLLNLLRRLPRMAKVYPNEMGASDRPLQIIFLTQRADAYQNFTRTFSASQIGQDIQSSLAQMKIPYRLTGFLGNCAPTDNCESEQTLHLADKNAYSSAFKVLSTVTVSQEHPFADFSANWKTMTEHWQASATALTHSRILLDQRPSDRDSIVVSLDNYKLDLTHWNYRDTAQVIELNWDKIPLSWIRKDSVILVEYK